MPHRSVRDAIADRKPYTASGATTVAAAAHLMKKHGVGALMIVVVIFLPGGVISLFEGRKARRETGPIGSVQG